MKILAPISLGELIDKITILEIKIEHVTDAEKRHNIRVELDELNKIYFPLQDRHLDNFHLELKEVNEKIWVVEDDIRKVMYSDASGSYYNEIKTGYNLGQLSEKTHRLNDQRAAIKKQINLQFGSEIIEEKLYV